MADIRVTWGPWTPEAYAEELSQLTCHVRRWFGEAAQSKTPPTVQGCRTFANYLMQFGPPPAEKLKPSKRRQAAKHARAFLRDIKSVRTDTELALCFARFLGLQEKFEEFQNELRIFDQASEHVTLTLKVMTKPSSGESTERVRFLGSLAQELWAETNQGWFPRSAKPGTPLNEVLGRALDAMSRSRSPAQINEIIRGRRRKTK